MTEDEWLTCDDPRPMLEFLRGTASARKLRLFAAACCRSGWQSQHLDEVCRRALATAEDVADGRAGAAAAGRARAAAVARSDEMSNVDLACCYAALYVAAANAPEPLTAFVHALDEDIAGRVVGDPAAISEGIRDDYTVYCDLVRDIFGNPFHRVILGPARLATDVVALGRSIYDGHTFSRMPELADSLERAGCRDGRVLAHLRQPGEHVRGCWLLDLVLGKE